MAIFGLNAVEWAFLARSPCLFMSTLFGGSGALQGQLVLCAIEVDQVFVRQFFSLLS